MELEVGDIVFVRGHTALSKLVRLFDKGEFSHVAVAVSESHVIEAEWNTKSIITPFSHKDYEIIRFDLSEVDKDRLIKKAIQLTGRWYDYPQMLGYMFHKETQWGNPKKLICSEIAYELLFEVGIDVKDRNIAPNQLYAALTLNSNPQKAIG